MKITSNRIVREALEKSTGFKSSFTPAGLGDAVLSKCCNAPTRTEGDVTKYSACLKCGQAV